MNVDTVMQLASDALMVALKVAGPFLVAGLVVGLGISIFQAATQIQEMTLTFIPKIAAMLAVIVLAGPWMMNSLITYTSDLFRSIPNVVTQR